MDIADRFEEVDLINERDGDGDQPIFVALDQGNVEIFKKLKERGASLHSCESSGYIDSCLATAEFTPEKVKLQIDYFTLRVVNANLNLKEEVDAIIEILTPVTKYGQFLVNNAGRIIELIQGSKGKHNLWI